jgi:hypothetical protein
MAHDLAIKIHIGLGESGDIGKFGWDSGHRRSTLKSSAKPLKS